MLHKLGKLLGLLGLLSLAPMATMSQDGYTLGVSISRLSNPFFISLVEGAQATADQLGVELIVVDAADNPSTEAANIEDLIAQGVDAILINPTDSDAVVPSVAAANAAGIPVFTIDRSANGGEIVSHIASDNVAGGALAAEYLCSALGGSGNVVELEGIPGTSAARDRGAGFNAYMAENCPGVTIVARQTANFNRAEGLTVFENILQAQADIDGVFAHNDDMILGAIEAANAAGRAGIVFVGFDAVDDAVAAVRAGTLAATVAQQPALMGSLGVETAVKALNGETVETFIPVSLRIVQNITLGVSISRLSNPFFISLVEGAQAVADEIGAELIVVDAADNPSTEAANIEDLIAQGVDAILINPTDSDAVVPSVAAANAAGIPVFTIDRSANGGEIVSHIASDNVAGGALAAEYLCSALGGSGNVVELEGIPGTSAARDRGAGFNAYMAENCPGVTIVARQTANFNRAEGLTVFENILQAQADIDGVFAHNDDMILGAIEAANAAGRAGIVFVGFDAVDDAVAAVRAGTLAATVAQQPALMGAIGVETAAAFLAGASVDASIPVGLSLVTND
ncbi:MAG: D-ribose ABC transporter substrate-binding protein [Anaerolineae bacterium]